MLDEADEQGVAAARRDFAALAEGWRVVSARSAPRARREAEVMVFNQMAVALWRRFEGCDAGVGLELRLLAEGVLAGGRFPAAARWRADMSVTGYAAGERISLSEEVFSRLAGVFLDGLARRRA